MDTLRKYGQSPFRIAVIHGGPGTPGEMAPVARELSKVTGILEPLQTATSIAGQVAELRGVLEDNAELPVTLIGHSWGAWLSYIFAAEYPSFVAKLILVSSGPFEERYARGIMDTRLSRLTEEERVEVSSIVKALNESNQDDNDALMARFGALMARADAYDPLPEGKNEVVECDARIYHNVWAEASKFRSSGRLLEYGNRIKCPVVAIQGDYDPHPAEGVKEPLSRVLKDFRFILLKKCGHTLWLERSARDEFYRILKREIAPSKSKPGATKT